MGACGDLCTNLLASIAVADLDLRSARRLDLRGDATFPPLLLLLCTCSLHLLKRRQQRQDYHSRVLYSRNYYRTMSRAEVIYTAASTNRFFQAAHVSPDGLVAFGSAKLVALWDTEVRCSTLYSSAPCSC